MDACKAAGCEYVLYSSAGDADKMNEKVTKIFTCSHKYLHMYYTYKVKHIKGKVVVEKYLLESGLKATVLRPVAFFENLDGLYLYI